jgi:glycosyltransferase involved in cell wall biosynthesis
LNLYQADSLKYSIIIPTLNEEKLLPGLLRQLNDQCFRDKFDIEIIISDGGSSDNTMDIAKKQADIVIPYNGCIRQIIAQGRNEGAKSASGNILVFVNGDILFPDVTEFFNYVNKYFIDSKYGAMTCMVQVFPEEEIPSDRRFHRFYNGYFKLLNKIGVGMGRGECQIIRKVIFEEMNGYNEKMAAGEDFDLFRRIKKKHNILFTDKIMVYESPRRYRKIGYWGVTWSWLINAFSVIIKDKSISKEWEQIR